MHPGLPARFVLLVLICLTPSAFSQTIRYVRADAPQGGNGLSWATAHRRLQDGIAAAQSGDSVWVASGTYAPGGPGGSREATFQLRSGVLVYGGFVGNETLLNQRDWIAQETILSGDLNRDDDIGGNASDNSFHVVTANNGVLATAVLDGFTIRRGSAYDVTTGGGLRADGGSPTLRNCLFENNEGGAVFLAGSARLISCRFSANQGHIYTAGAIQIAVGMPRVIGCSFIGNTSAYGGAIRLASASGVALHNCYFVGNTATEGGALYSSSPSTIHVTNCTFAGNHSTSVGRGGGVRLLGPTNGALIRNSIFWGNTDGGAMSELAQLSIENPDTGVDYCRVQGWTGLNNGIHTDGIDPLFSDIDGSDDIPGTNDDDLRLRPGSSSIDAGNNFYVPPDGLDLDGDGDTKEPTPFDFAAMDRFMDDPATADTGTGSPPIVDIGAFEYAGKTQPCAADFNRDGALNSQDFFDFLTAFFAGCP